MKYHPLDYQRDAIRFLIANRSAGLFLDPGLGKTSISLAAVNALKRAGAIRSVLVVAPLRVVYSVWPAERDKWDQFSGLSMEIVHGDAKRRRAALSRPADLYLINPEGVPWLRESVEAGSVVAPFDMLIVDESTKFKSSSARRWRALKALLPMFSRRAILTGTPSPNSLEDLWSQVFILDGGDRLGSFISHYRSRYFYRSGFQGREWYPYERSQAAIESLISDIVLRLDAQDLLDLPELVINDIEVELPRSCLVAYKRLERTLLFSLDRDGIEGDPVDVEAMSAAAKYLLCRQIANGGFYVDEVEADGSKIRSSEVAHNAKIDAVADLADELQGKPLMVCYSFRHDLERLRARFGKSVPHIGGDVSPKATDEIVARWNRGELPLLFVQPAAMSHGLNMQAGGHDIAWLGLTDDLEVYLQTNARIYRQGVDAKRVRIHRILARGTVDQAIRRRIDKKDANQKTLLDALKAYAADEYRAAG